MAKSTIAKVFMQGRSQAVGLPKEFRLPGDRARVRRTQRGILPEPMAADLDAWFREFDRFSGIPFMEEGRQQPPMPRAKKTFA